VYVSVAVPIPAAGLLTYRVPDEWGAPAVGARVLVPVGARTLTGIVVDRADAPAESITVKALLDVLDSGFFLPPDVVRLAQWVSEYYLSSPGEAMAAAMPPRAEVETERRVRLTDAGRAALEAGHLGRGVRARALRLLADGKLQPIAKLARQLAEAGTRRGAHAIANALAADGLVQIELPLVGRSDGFRTEKVAAVTA
jgi:primosomal protein N'